MEKEWSQRVGNPDGGEKVGGIEGRETIIGIYYMRKNTYFNKKKKA